MKGIFKVIFYIIIFLIIIHYKKYKNYTIDYEIQQQELDYVDGNDLYNQLNPLIITFIEKNNLLYNVNKYSLQSIMSFRKKQILYNTDNSYLSHKNEIILTIILLIV